MQKAERNMRKTAHSSASSAYCLVPTAYFFIAELRQDEVLRSISDNVSSSGDGSATVFLGILAAIVALIVLVALINARSKRKSTPKAANHPGKLLKELTRQIQLRPAELKQLKLLAQGERDAGKEIDSPLVFLLCPSALVDAARSQRVKIDRKVLAGLAQKLGLAGAAAKAKR
jgi:hypothetical protein